MKIMVTGDNIRVVKVNEGTDEPTPSAWFSDKARKQRRDKVGRFVRAQDGAKKAKEKWERFFVLAKRMG